MRRIVLGMVCVMVAIAGVAAQQPRTRETTPDAYKWNLAEMFPSDEAWQAEKARISAEFAKARRVQGHAVDVGARLQEALDLQTAQDKAFSRSRSTPAEGRRGHTRGHVQGMKDQVIQMVSAFGNRVGLPRARDSGHRSGDPRRSASVDARTEGLHLLPARRDPTKGAYAQCHRRSADAGADRADGGRER